MQLKPASSSTWSAVLLPEPDLPLMMTSFIARRGGGDSIDVVTRSHALEGSSIEINASYSAPLVGAARRCSRLRSSAKTRASSASTLRCASCAFDGTTSANSMSTGRPSMASNDTAWSRRISAPTIRLHSSSRQCGIAMPSPRPVEPNRSRAVSCSNSFGAGISAFDAAMSAAARSSALGLLFAESCTDTHEGASICLKSITTLATVSSGAILDLVPKGSPAVSFTKQLSCYPALFVKGRMTAPSDPFEHVAPDGAHRDSLFRSLVLADRFGLVLHDLAIELVR